eukprot:TRINITY_DN921_c0_g1_i1.p1 TRINITY_DN921_c0_g1~~TRINITY_DN921_c0_g1_i1.p1  ORF type:complete len:378 (-),score=107.77 TRINITY_DN921_c0_g1_i1:122-1171(-)
MSAEEALKSANSLFVEENFEEALKFYDRAIQSEPNVDSFLKRSTCHYKLENFTDALDDANSAIKLDQNNSKAYVRKGMAAFGLDEYETASAAFRKALQLEPDNSMAKTWLRKCDAEIGQEQSEQKQETPQPTSVTNNAPPSNPTPPTQPTQVSTSASKIRHEWYQTQTDISVTVFVKNVKKEDASIQIQRKSLTVSIKLSDSSEYALDIDLCGEVIPEQSSFEILSTKIEIKMKKASGARWKTLEDVGEQTKPWDSVTGSKVTTQKKNWDAFVKEEAKDEKLEGDEGLNKLFQDIFAGGTDEQKKAMMKSYLESGGTVLSTDWNEVGKGEVKGAPPKGMEMHKWSEMTK